MNCKKLSQPAVPTGFEPTTRTGHRSQTTLEATQFFDKKFDLEKGTYSVTIKCAVNGREVMLKQASFTLYDYHITTIKSQKEDFKFGAGIYYPTNQPKQVWALLSKAS